MTKIAITTDSNSGIIQDLDKHNNLFVLPMPFLIDGNEYFENVNLSVDQFFEFQMGGSSISTSQPSIVAVQEIWSKALEQFDYVIHIPMSSSLSSTCSTATMLATEEPFAGRVFVVDNKRISVVQKQAVFDAVYLANQGKSIQQILEYLNQTADQNSIYIMVPDLKYLKKGGRITKTAAAIGTLLKIKPVLQIHGGKLDAYAKVMNIKLAKDKIISAIKKDIETQFANISQDQQLELAIAYTYDKNIALDFKKDVEQHFPQLDIKLIDPLSLSVTCHTGPNCLALAVSVVLK